MDSQFYKRLDNFWDYVALSGRKYLFLLRLCVQLGMLEAHVVITLLEGGAVRVRIVSQSKIELFTDGMLASIREDICRLVRDIYSKCNVITGEYVFAKKCRKLSWNVDQSFAEEA